MSAVINVLAGVNGAGKSSVAGEALLKKGVQFFNPDNMARQIREKNSTCSLTEANSLAWQMGCQGLERALANDDFFAFETTLGGHTITDLLLSGARLNNVVIHLSYMGLNSVELHIERVKKRVETGGHDISEQKIKERYQTSRENLIRLMPHLSSLYIYDNSAEADPEPSPVKLLYMNNGKIKTCAPIEEIADWAKPLLAMAIKIDG